MKHQQSFVVFRDYVLDPLAAVDKRGAHDEPAGVDDGAPEHAKEAARRRGIEYFARARFRPDRLDGHHCLLGMERRADEIAAPAPNAPRPVKARPEEALGIRLHGKAARATRSGAGPTAAALFGQIDYLGHVPHQFPPFFACATKPLKARERNAGALG